MDIQRARYLVSDRGRDDLRSVAGAPAADPVALSTRLRASHEPFVAAALGEQLSLRARASSRIDDPDTWLYTASGLQMMTHPLVAQRRAHRLATLGFAIADLTCGLGGDLRALAETPGPTFGLEQDGPTALLAAANVPRGTVIRGDAARPPLDVGYLAIVLDPSRREGGSREPDPASFSPPWATSLGLAAGASAAVLKGPPGIKDRDIPPAAEVEFVQVGRSLRESALWFGGDAVPGLRRAVHLPSGSTIESTAPEAPDATLPVGSFVLDPESCVTRAGLVRHLAAQVGASLLDHHVAYLTASNATSSPLAAAFEVLDVIPFGVRALKSHLRSRHWRPEEIRRRAFPIEPDELRRLLGKIEGDPVALLCTTLAGKRTVIVARKTPPRPTAKACRQ
ncbi:MAG: hypothetical protein AB7T37_08000 [Dehalococcoidia bacterium]